MTVLAALPADGVTTAGLAARVLDDSHALDDGRSLSTIVLKGLWHLRGRGRGASGGPTTWRHPGRADYLAAPAGPALEGCPTDASWDPALPTATLHRGVAVHEERSSAICSPTWGPDRRAASGPTTIWRAEPPHPGGRGLTDGDGPQAGGR